MPFTQGCFEPSLVGNGTVVLQQKIFLPMYVHYHLSLEKGTALHLNEIKSHSPKNYNAKFT